MKAKDLKPTVSAALASLLVTLLLLLSTTAFAAQETEPNDKLGQANTVVSGDSMRGTFGYAGDLDFYRITVNSPGRLRCSVTTPPANIRASLTLNNRHADYTFVTATAVNPGDDVHLTYDITRPGTYFIRLHDPDNHVSTDPYTFTATFSPVVDAYEPNNDLGQATLAPATTLYGTIFDSTDVDYYKIYVTAGSTLRLSMVSPVKMRSALTLYNPDLNYLFVAAEAVNPGDPVSLEHKAADGGFYYIRVHDADGGAHLSAYTLSIAGGNPGYTPPWNPVTLEVEDNGSIPEGQRHGTRQGRFPGTIAPAGDKDWFRLETKQAGRLTFPWTPCRRRSSSALSLHDRSGHRHPQRTALEWRETSSPLTYDATARRASTISVGRHGQPADLRESYTFSANLPAVKDPYEPNNDYGDATPQRAQPGQRLSLQVAVMRWNGTGVISTPPRLSGSS
jgi:hypothetical protein